MTVFLLHDGSTYALRKRPASGLLAGLWEFPHVEETLELPQVLSRLEQWGIEALDVEKQVEKTHIFTHVQWHMTGFFIRCRPSGSFRWEDPKALALPTAFRIFLDD